MKEPNQFKEEFIGFENELKSYVYRLVTHKQDTEDIVQETYLKMRKGLSTYNNSFSFKTWIFTIATNLVRDDQRAKSRWKADSLDDCRKAAEANTGYRSQIESAFQNQQEANFEIAEHINLCFTCVAKNLDIRQQFSVILKEVYQFKRSEIAEVLGVTEGVVKHLLFQGRKQLMTTYEDRCALVSKQGVCHQCAELNDYLQSKADSDAKISALGLRNTQNSETNLDQRFQIISQINPLNSPGAELEDTILQMLKEVNGET